MITQTPSPSWTREFGSYLLQTDELTYEVVRDGSRWLLTEFQVFHSPTIGRHTIATAQVHRPTMTAAKRTAQDWLALATRASA